MELLVKRIIVMIITISVVVPSVYFTMSYYQGSQYEKNPANFIPADSNFLARVTTGSGTFYLYIENLSIAIMMPLSVFLLPQILVAAENAENVTVNATLQYYQEYRGVSIFRIDGVNATEIINTFSNNSAYVSAVLNSTQFYGKLDNITFYIASPQNSFSIIGGVEVLRNSIDAYTDYTGIVVDKGVSFNDTSNLSAYYYPTVELNVSHLSLNISYDSSEMYISFNNLSSTTLLSLSTIAVRYGIEVYLHENSVEFVLGMGVWPLIEFIQSRGGIASLVGQIST